MKVSILGSGYVGLVTALGLCEIGHDVICVDVDPLLIEMLSKGQCPIHEPGLDVLIRKHIGKKFNVSLDACEAISITEATMIAVGTPIKNGSIELNQVRDAAQIIGSSLANKMSHHIVIVKSTVVPGTTNKYVKDIIEAYSGKKEGLNFSLVMNPEFLREGSAVSDFMKPDRIVLGGSNEAVDMAEKIYEPFTGARFLKTDANSAELIKYCSNSFFAMLISFSNEIANLSGEIGVDGLQVFEGLLLDKRFNHLNSDGLPEFVSYLKPGCGYGGSCFPKDVKALISFADSLGKNLKILKAVDETNEYQADEVIKLLNEKLGTVADMKVAVIGLGFKSGTADLRESAAIKISKRLINLGAKVFTFDELIKIDIQTKILKENTALKKLSEIPNDCSAVVVMNSLLSNEELKNEINSRKNTPVVVDCRRVFSSGDFKKYAGIGYPTEKNM